MPKYEFIRVEMKRGREGLELAEDYREIIREQASTGWKLVQIVPFEQHVRPHIDLVFKRTFTRKGETQ